MRVTELGIPGVLLIESAVFTDARGTFRETWREDQYREAGIGNAFVQDNVSVSRGGVLRGLHMQAPRAQAKLINVLSGEIFDVCVDMRPDSPTWLKWVGVTLAADSGRQLYIPRGFAHGFAVTGDHAVVAYKCDAYYDAASELTILWNDPDLAIDWPLANPIISEKDWRAAPARDVAARLR